jgi:hypothetical protein
MDVTSDFNHRGAALEVVRKTIREEDPNRRYQHDLMDFNNQKSFSIIKALLQRSKDNLQKSLTKDKK